MVLDDGDVVSAAGGSRLRGSLNDRKSNGHPSVVAGWPADSTSNVPLCTAGKTQYFSIAVPDGVGGVIVAWEDQRDSSATDFDIYAQHLLSSGDADPIWPVNGVALCTAVHNQLYPSIVSDGAGGAIVCWMDQRDSTTTGTHVYAQHVLSTGLTDAAWSMNGATVCNAGGLQRFPRMVSDGSAGAIVTWDDSRTGSPTGFDVYAQHVLGTGGMDPSWPVNGVTVCNASRSQITPEIVTDGAGGAIVAWTDARQVATGNDIYAQRVLSTGLIAPGWPANGVALCTASGSQRLSGILAAATWLLTTSADVGSNAIVTDGAGGALVTWLDARTPATTGTDIYAQRVRTDGTLAPGWAANGVALCAADSNQTSSSLLPDGTGGAIAMWTDMRHGTTTADIYSQRVLSSGTMAWASDGVAIQSAAGDASTGSIFTYPLAAGVRDGAGGAIIVWKDSRNLATTGLDAYARHMLSTGVFDPAWPPGGVALSRASGDQSVFQAVCSDAAGGAIVAWDDGRNAATTGMDIYAQRVVSTGAIVDVASPPVPHAVEAALSFALTRVVPNPSASLPVRVEYAVAREAHVSIRIVDAAGRVVATLAQGTMPPGRYETVWKLDGGVPTGMYFVNYEVVGKSHTRRVVVLR